LERWELEIVWKFTSARAPHRRLSGKNARTMPLCSIEATVKAATTMGTSCRFSDLGSLASRDHDFLDLREGMVRLDRHASRALEWRETN
jgi:hypothetical protein